MTLCARGSAERSRLEIAAEAAIVIIRYIDPRSEPNDRSSSKYTGDHSIVINRLRMNDLRIRDRDRLYLDISSSVTLPREHKKEIKTKSYFGEPQDSTFASRTSAELNTTSSTKQLLDHHGSLINNYRFEEINNGMKVVDRWRKWKTKNWLAILFSVTWKLCPRKRSLVHDGHTRYRHIHARVRKAQHAEIRAISGRLPWLKAIIAGLLGSLSERDPSILS